MMELYLVFVPRGNLLKDGERLQKYFQDRYNIYPDDILPPLHITLFKLILENKEELDHAKNIIKTVCSRTSPIEIEGSNFGYFQEPHKSIHININKNTYLNKLYCNLYKGFKRENIKTWDYTPEAMHFHITLVGGFFGRRWSEEEAQEAYSRLQDQEIFRDRYKEKIERLELWYPEYQPKVKVDSVFKLKGEE